jgi:hypothetical protein
MTTASYSISGRRLGRFDHMPNMQNIEPTLEERILRALRPEGSIKTFDQIAMLSGSLRPEHIQNPERFHATVDVKLRELMTTGKVRLVARRPELCFTLGTVLDRIVKELDLSDGA